VKNTDKTKKAFRYWVDRNIRASVMSVMSWITPRSREESVNLQRQEIKRILLVRALFRMGDSILATPAILLLRKNFSSATIDFVGPSIAKKLFVNLPIDNQYEVYQRFPKVCWSYVALLRLIRKRNYDLAIDVSGSSAALGSVIVGLSSARFRVGIRGKWDRWFNVRLARPLASNKYANLPQLIASLGLKSQEMSPTVVLSAAEKVEGEKRIRALLRAGTGPIVGIFVGGRKSRGKRWASANFGELATLLRAQGVRPIIFVGPEEKDILAYLQTVLGYRAPVMFEPEIKKFASLVANCDLFVACDSGPVHLACALRVRTVVLFLQANFERWGPPVNLGRIVFRRSGVTVNDALEACRIELDALFGENVAVAIVNG
jgi:ADP-heptose:LPS heptosyltransferase